MDKEQVQHMVRQLLKLPGNPQADAADALGGCPVSHPYHAELDPHGGARIDGARVVRGRLR